MHLLIMSIHNNDNDYDDDDDNDVDDDDNKKRLFKTFGYKNLGKIFS